MPCAPAPFRSLIYCQGNDRFLITHTSPTIHHPILTPPIPTPLPFHQPHLWCNKLYIILKEEFVVKCDELSIFDQGKIAPQRLAFSHTS
jgi:hypothetical protein